MTRLQNAKEMLTESLTALESAIALYQMNPSIDTTGKSLDSTGMAQGKSLDMLALASDIVAIESELDEAMKLISNLNETYAVGDTI